MRRGSLKDLESYRLIGTGPRVAYENKPWDTVIAIGLYSKREYAFLSEQGYKEANNIASTPQSNTKQAIAHMHFSGNTFTNSPIGVGESVSQTINAQVDTSNETFVALQNDVDLNALADELEQLRKHLQQSASSSSDYQRLALLSDAEEHAKKHDGSKAMEILSKVGKGALGVAKDIGTEIAAKVIAGSMGLEL